MTQIIPTKTDRLTIINRNHYNQVWRDFSIRHPRNFNTWSTLMPLSLLCPKRLEVGPGNWPRLPIKGTLSVDLSPVAAKRLSQAGGNAIIGNICNLPFPDQYFELVCAFDVVEHVTNSSQAISELSRVLKDNCVIFISLPLRAENWHAFDMVVGHGHRYELDELNNILKQNNLEIIKICHFGSMPRCHHLVKLGLRLYRDFRKLSVFIHEIFFPISQLLQSKLVFNEGFSESAKNEEILLVCRRVTQN